MDTPKKYSIAISLYLVRQIHASRPYQLFVCVNLQYYAVFSAKIDSRHQINFKRDSNFWSTFRLPFSNYIDTLGLHFDFRISAKFEDGVVNPVYSKKKRI